MTRIKLFSISMVLGTMVLMAAESHGLRGPKSRESKALGALHSAIVEMVEADAFCTHNRDCGLLAMGHRACGGPAGFLVMSKKNLNIKEIRFLSDSLGRRARKFNMDNGVVSICSLAPLPRFHCSRRNTCEEY